MSAAGGMADSTNTMSPLSATHKLQINLAIIEHK